MKTEFDIISKEPWYLTLNWQPIISLEDSLRATLDKAQINVRLSFIACSELLNNFIWSEMPNIRSTKLWKPFFSTMFDWKVIGWWIWTIFRIRWLPSTIDLDARVDSSLTCIFFRQSKTIILYKKIWYRFAKKEVISTNSVTTLKLHYMLIDKILES